MSEQHTPGPWKATGTVAFGLSEVISPAADFSQRPPDSRGIYHVHFIG